MTAMTMDFSPRSFYILQGAPGWQAAPKESPNSAATSAAKIDLDNMAFDAAKDIAAKRLASMSAADAGDPNLKNLKSTLENVTVKTAATAGGLFQSLFDFLRRIFRAVVNSVCRMTGAQMQEGDPPAGLNIHKKSPAADVAQNAAKACAEVAKSLAQDEELFVRLAQERASGNGVSVLRESLGRAEKGLVDLATEMAQKTERFNDILAKDSKKLGMDKALMRILLANGEKVGSDALVQAHREVAELKEVETMFGDALGVMIEACGMERVLKSKVLADFPFAAGLIKKFSITGRASGEVSPQPRKPAHVGPLSPDPTMTAVPSAGPKSTSTRPVFGRKASTATGDGPVAEIDLEDDEDSNVVRMRSPV